MALISRTSGWCLVPAMLLGILFISCNIIDLLAKHFLKPDKTALLRRTELTVIGLLLLLLPAAYYHPNSIFIA